MPHLMCLNEQQARNFLLKARLAYSSVRPLETPQMAAKAFFLTVALLVWLGSAVVVIATDQPARASCSNPLDVFYSRCAK